MPMDRKRYPDNWGEIRQRIRFERAQNRCEECGVPNGALIARSDIDGWYYLIWNDEIGGLTLPSGEKIPQSEIPAEYLTKPFTRVVLTVHHIGVDKPDGTMGDPRDKMDCRDENLIALCQRCHLLADMPINIPARKVTRHVHRHERIRATGQQELL